MVEEIATFIDSESTRFSLGTSTFINSLPDEPNRASSVIETPGAPADYVFANDLPVNENARVAITTRSTSSATARADANAAWVAVQKIANEALSGKTWLRAAPVQSPFFLKRDEQNRPMFQFNVACTRRTTST